MKHNKQASPRKVDGLSPICDDICAFSLHCTGRIGFTSQCFVKSEKDLGEHLSALLTGRF